MKKIISILLVILMMTALLVPCVSAENTYDGKTVIIVTGNLRGYLDMYERVSAAKADFESKGADVILLDAGNYLQGESYANSDRGLSIYNLMDKMGYDAAAMGTFEFVYGDATTGFMYHSNFFRYFTQSELKNGAEAVTYNQNYAGSATASRDAKAPANFAVISSNINIEEDATGYYDFDKNVVIEKDGGLKVGVIAITNEGTPDMLQDGFMDGYTFCDVEAPEADITVCLNNDGMQYDDADIVVDSSAGYMGIWAYVIDNTTKAIQEFAIGNEGTDAATAAAIAEIKANAKPLIGKCVVTLNGADSYNWIEETNLGDLTADALLWYANNKFEGFKKDVPVVAIQNGGNCDQFIYNGAITETDLLRALPFSPMGVGILYVTGAQLLETLEAGTCPNDSYGLLCPGFAQVAGLEYTVAEYADYDAGEAYGKFYKADSINRVTITSVNGKAFDENATYAVIADNFLMNGNDTYYVFKDVKSSEGATYLNNGNGVKTRDIVAMYIKEVLKGEVGEQYAEPQGRITIKLTPFTDVKEDAYYYDAVMWATYAGITNGTSATTFSPNKGCTRAQAVTMLWRACGEPEAETTNNPFTDVKESDYYYDAVLWAVENGITNGTSATKFSPNAACTRGQIVTFIYRTVAEGETVTADNPFTDVKQGDYCYNAVLWAVENGITNGMSATKFAPNLTCTRGQIVTFMYRV